MRELVITGKKRTILIAISILIVSIHTIYNYQSIRLDIETKKLIQQAIRFLLTIGLLVFVYKGKKMGENCIHHTVFNCSFRSINCIVNEEAILYCTNCYDNTNDFLEYLIENK